MIDSGFIRIYNKMIDDNSEHRVTPDELYVYSILFINRRQDGSILSNIRIIESTMSEKAMISNRQATNRKKIKEALIGLVKKNVLLLTCDIQIEDITTDTVFTMRINDKQLSKNGDKDTFNGYEELMIDNFKMMLSPSELLIYINSQRFSNDGGFKGSYERWSKLLNVSRNTAFKLLNDAEKRGIITVVRGKHIAKNRQEINQYFSVDFMDDKQEPIEQESQVKEESNESIDQSNQQEPAVAFGSKEDKVVAFDAAKRGKQEVQETIEHEDERKSLSPKERVGDRLPF